MNSWGCKVFSASPWVFGPMKILIMFFVFLVKPRRCVHFRLKIPEMEGDSSMKWRALVFLARSLRRFKGFLDGSWEGKWEFLVGKWRMRYVFGLPYINIHAFSAKNTTREAKTEAVCGPKSFTADNRLLSEVSTWLRWFAALTECASLSGFQRGA